MKNTGELLLKAKGRHKKNYNASLCNQADVINVDNYVYLRIERKDPS